MSTVKTVAPLHRRPRLRRQQLPQNWLKSHVRLRPLDDLPHDLHAHRVMRPRAPARYMPVISSTWVLNASPKFIASHSFSVSRRTSEPLRRSTCPWVAPKQVHTPALSRRFCPMPFTTRRNLCEGKAESRKQKAEIGRTKAETLKTEMLKGEGGGLWTTDY